MRQLLLAPFLGALALACSQAGSRADGATGASSEAWTSGTPACGTALSSWNGISAYSNGSCFGNVNCINCDGQGFTVHTSSNGQSAYGGAWQCVELVTRTFDTKFGIWLSNNAGTPLCNSAKATSGLTVYYSGGPEPVAGDALVWNYNGGIGHTALVSGNSASSVSYIQQNWGSPSGYAATGTTAWNGSDFGAPSDSLGGFTPACWIHANANTTGTCVYGNGLYCGNNGVKGDPSTLYTCTNGTLSVDEVCGVSCVNNPPKVNDACAPCPKGDGMYCGGGGVGKDPKTVYLCKAGQVTPVETCSLGCRHQPSTTTDAWNDACVANDARQPSADVAVSAPSDPAPPPAPPSDRSGGCNAGGATSSGSPQPLTPAAGLLASLTLALLRRRRARPA